MAERKAARAAALAAAARKRLMFSEATKLYLMQSWTPTGTKSTATNGARRWSNSLFRFS
jgi:hypothetical protein